MSIASEYLKQWRAKNPEKSRIAVHKYYLKNIEQRKAYAQTRRLAVRQMINDAKSSPCVDCNIQYPTYVMQFDHRDPKLKSFTIGTSVALSIETVRAEIAKCDLVCANCHAERTHKQRCLFDDKSLRSIRKPLQSNETTTTISI